MLPEEISGGSGVVLADNFLLLETKSPGRAGNKVKFIEQRLEKLRAVPDEQLRELARLMGGGKFPAGEVACRAELDNRLSNSARPQPHLLLVTGVDGADEMRALVGIGGMLEAQSQGSGVTKALDAVEEMLLSCRVAMEESDDRRDFLKLQMGLAF
jgi:hypothetical protein